MPRVWSARTFVSATCGMLAVVGVCAVRAPAVAHAGDAGDFNDDGFADLVVGVPGEDIGLVTDAGAVHVFYGGAGGVSAAGSTFLHENAPGVPGNTAVGDRFGAAAVAGDFNGDGIDDLAVGVPGKAVDARSGAGRVVVFRGSTEGVTTVAVQWLSQPPTSAEPSGPEAGDEFGAALAAIDAGGTTVEDLFAGSPGEDRGGHADRGAVAILPGSSAGLQPGAARRLPDSFYDGAPPPGAGDRLGATLAAGVTNGRRATIITGAPGYTWGGERPGAGGVQLNYLSDFDSAPYSTGGWVQGKNRFPGTASAGDGYGSALVLGRFNADAYDDVAVSAPGDAEGGAPGSGVVHVLYSNGDDIFLGRHQVVHQNSARVADTGEVDDGFGSALAAANVGGDGREDLIVGAPGEDLNGVIDAGAAWYLPGSAGGVPATTGARFLHQNAPGIPGSAEPGDRFGSALAAGAYATGVAGVAIGSPGDAPRGIDAAGALAVLTGALQGPGAAGGRLFHQDALYVRDAPEPRDGFSSVLP